MSSVGGSITVVLGTLWTVFPLLIQKFAVPARIEVESYPRTIGWSADDVMVSWNTS